MAFIWSSCDAPARVTKLRAQLRESLAAFREVFRNPSLRRLQLAYAGSEIGDWGASIALSVLAFERSGAAGVGVLLVIRMVPAALAAPLTSVLGDRYHRARVMISADLVRSAAMACAAAVSFAGGPVWILYALAGLVAVASTAFRPAQAAIVPSLARTPAELTAANAVSSTIEGAASFLGPAIGGVILAASNAGVSFAIASGTFVWSALLISQIGPGASSEAEEREATDGDQDLWPTITAGFRTIAIEPSVRLIVGLFGAQTLVAGALNVLVVVIALDFLGTGDRGLGALNAALGIGGIVGAIAALGLVGRRRLASAFGLGAVFWGVPIALIAAWDTQAGILFLLGVVGLANTVVDVSGFTLLQRAVPDAVLARVFGVLESLFLATVALGAIVASALVDGIGTRATLIVTGALLPVLVALAWARLRTIDAAAPAPGPELDLLRGVPFLAFLPPATIEHLATRLVGSRGAGRTRRHPRGRPRRPVLRRRGRRGRGHLRGRGRGVEATSARAASSARSRSYVTCPGRPP